MGVALVMTTSRGGIISLVAEVVFLAVVTAIWRTQNERHRTKSSPLKSVAVRAGMAGALLVGLFFGVLLLGDGDSFQEAFFRFRLGVGD